MSKIRGQRTRAGASGHSSLSPSRERTIAKQNEELRNLIFAMLDESEAFRAYLSKMIRRTRLEPFEIREACARDAARKFVRLHRWRSGKEISEELAFGMLYYLMYGDRL